MNLDLPPSYQKGKKLVPYRCDTCGDRACRKKWYPVFQAIYDIEVAVWQQNSFP